LCIRIPFAEERLIYAVAHDVSDRVSAEEALRQSEEKFRQLAENSRDVFWMYDAIKHQYVYISPAYDRIWCQTRENLYANPYLFLEIIHPEDQERVRAAIETTRQGENQDIEYRIVRPNGDVRWISDRGLAIAAFPSPTLQDKSTALQALPKISLIANKLKNNF
jgi:PAS domain S-box-containing protein